MTETTGEALEELREAVEELSDDDLETLFRLTLVARGGEGKPEISPTGQVLLTPDPELPGARPEGERDFWNALLMLLGAERTRRHSGPPGFEA